MKGFSWFQRFVDKCIVPKDEQKPDVEELRRRLEEAEYNQIQEIFARLETEFSEKAWDHIADEIGGFRYGDEN